MNDINDNFVVEAILLYIVIVFVSHGCVQNAVVRFVSCFYVGLSLFLCLVLFVS